MSRSRFGLVAVLVSAGAVAACQVVAGISDLRTGELPDGGTGADGGSGGGSGGGGADGGGDGGSPATEPKLAGQVTYLAPGNRVVLTTGIQDVTVGAEGAFAFPGPVGAGSSYTVTVKEQPAGQNCWVANGSGTVGAGGVADLDVRCSRIVQVREPGSMATTTSATVLAPLPGQSALTVNLSRPTSMLLVLHVSSLRATASSTAEIALRVDDRAPIGHFNRFISEGNPISATTSVVVNLPAGQHTVTGLWRLGNVGQADVIVNGGGYGTELDAIALESLPGFQAAVGTAIAGRPTTLGYQEQDKTLTSLRVPTKLQLGAEQPVFMSARIPFVWGEHVVGALTVDDTPVAVGKENYTVDQYNAMTFVPSLVDRLPAGEHTLDAKWARFESGCQNVVDRVQPNGEPALDGAVTAVVFRPETPSGALKFFVQRDVTNVDAGAWQPVVLNGTKLHFDVSPPRESHALVVFHASSVRATRSNPDPNVDLGLFVDETKVAVTRLRRTNNIDWNSAAAALFSTVTIPAGKHAIELRVKTDQDGAYPVQFSPMETTNLLTSFSYVQLD